jgi:membrane protease YdiL (CAAX protease family)
MHNPSHSKVIREEVGLVLGLSLLPSAFYALISLTERPIRGTSVSLNRAVLGWPDGARQLISIVFGLMPVLLVGHLLRRGGETWSDVGVDATQPARDLSTGTVIAALIGGGGLALYLSAFHFGLSRAVIPVNDGGVWWQIPLLLLSALRFGLLEETVVLGYLLRRLGQLGLRSWPATLVSAVLRGSYHLYQGYGAFVGNFIMGILFARWRLSGRRTVPLIVAHALIDAVTFVGWIALHKKLAWLPH